MENSLPPIIEMYNSTRDNRDYNVIRKYQGIVSHQSPKRSITKKDHYLDIALRMTTSPGPASICYFI